MIDIRESHHGWRTMINPWIESPNALLLKDNYPCKFDVHIEQHVLTTILFMQILNYTNVAIHRNSYLYGM